jgi:hypothetical protein
MLEGPALPLVWLITDTLAMVTSQPVRVMAHGADPLAAVKVMLDRSVI